ncbi:AlpA family phage regulatory protein [Alkalimarinus alittae]
MNKYEKFNMRIMRLKEVMNNTGLGRSTIYNYIDKDKISKISVIR